MIKKIGIHLIWVVLVVASAFGIFISDKYDFALGEAFAGGLFAVFFERAWRAGEDITDIVDWKVSQRQLLRGGTIKKDTIIRISFAYLFRIKVGNKYLLMKNERGTGKYQPVGGVYKLKGDERLKLNNLFHVVDDDKVPIDESSREDYRLQMPCRYLRKFVKRFNSEEASRERVNNLSREFKEELGKYLNWDSIKYRYCGRHMTELKYGDHFQCYELLLADIVELIPSEKQKKELAQLTNNTSANCRFATVEEIKGLGIIPGTDKLEEWIADHSMKVLQENEQYLLHEPGTGETYDAPL